MCCLLAKLTESVVSEKLTGCRTQLRLEMVARNMIKSIGRGTTFDLRVLQCLWVCFFVCSFTTMAAADTYPRQSGIDALNYAFRLTLTDDTDEIVGEATIDIRFLKDNLTEFALDLASVNGGKGMTVSQVQLGVAPIRFTHEADILRIRLDPPSKAGERRQFIVRYGPALTRPLHSSA